MNDSRKEKIQLTLPKEIVKRIEDSLQVSFLTKSNWFLKAALKLLEEEEKERPLKKINLDV